MQVSWENSQVTPVKHFVRYACHDIKLCFDIASTLIIHLGFVLSFCFMCRHAVSFQRCSERMITSGSAQCAELEKRILLLVISKQLFQLNFCCEVQFLPVDYFCNSKL